MIPRYNVDHKNPSFSNVWELQPLLIQLSSSPSKLIEPMVCIVCSMFSVNSRQCCVCKCLTCLHCSINSTQLTPSGEEEKDPLTGLPYPDTCNSCKVKNKLIVGTLGEPNVLEGIQQENLFKIQFGCPYQCDKTGMNIDEVQAHSIWFCDLKPFEVKA